MDQHAEHETPLSRETPLTGYSATGDNAAILAFVYLQGSILDVTEHMETRELKSVQRGTVHIELRWDHDTWRIANGCYVGPFNSDATLSVTWMTKDGTPHKSIARVTRTVDAPPSLPLRAWSPA